MNTIYSASRNPGLTAAAIQEYSVALTAATANTAGAVVSIANPLGVDLIITNAYMNITTAATTSTNTINAGVAANGTTSSNTLFDTQATTAGLKTAGGTNGAVPRLWPAGQYLTATASATLVGLVGTLNLVFIRA